MYIKILAMLRILVERSKKDKRRERKKKKRYNFGWEIIYFVFLICMANIEAISKEYYIMKYIDYNNILKLLVVRYVLIKINLFCKIYDAYNTSHSY